MAVYFLGHPARVGIDRKVQPMAKRTAPSAPTTRQLQILDYLRKAIKDNSRPPTLDEIRKHFGWHSTNAARSHLVLMEKKGLIRLNKNSHRGIVVSETETPHSKNVPLLGEAPAGRPVEEIAQTEERLTVDAGMFPQNNLFAIRVRGDSMVGAGINDRDVALIHYGAEARSGAIILARLNSEVTVKRLLSDADSVRLHAENPAYQDITVNAWDDFTIVGPVVGVMRTL